MNSILNLNLTIFSLANIVRAVLLFSLVLYIIFALLTMRQVGILTKAIQTDDDKLINLLAVLLLVAGIVLFVLLAWVTFI